MNRFPLLAMLFFHLACAMRARNMNDEIAKLREPEVTMTDFDHRYLDNRPPPSEYDG